MNEVSCENDGLSGACPSGWLNIGVVIVVFGLQFNVELCTQARRLVR